MLKKRLAVLVLAAALSIGLMPGMALAEGGSLTAGDAVERVALEVQAAGSPTLTLTRANTGKLAMKVGATYKLGAQATAGSVAYASSNKIVASVTAKGAVKAKKAGKATITVIAKNGSKKAVKKVTVTVVAAKKHKAVKSITAKASSKSVKVDKTAKIKVTFTPTKSSNKNVIFKSSNSKVLAVDAAGKVTALAPGTAKVTVTSCDNAKKKAVVAIKVTAPVRESLDAYSWPEIKAIANEIAAAKTNAKGLAIAKKHNLIGADGVLTGAETKAIELADGTQTSVQILGFRHDEKKAGGKVGITFGFADVPMVHYVNEYNGYQSSNAGGWKKSDIRAWLKSDFYNLLPTDLKGKIVAVKKLTNNKGETSSTSSVTATYDKLWLLSMREVYGEMVPSPYDFFTAIATFNAQIPIYNVEGSQYQLYADNGVTIGQYSFAAKPGAESVIEAQQDEGPNAFWMLRSATPTGSYSFKCVSKSGSDGTAYAGTTFNGVSPAFCL